MRVARWWRHSAGRTGPEPPRSLQHVLLIVKPLPPSPTPLNTPMKQHTATPFGPAGTKDGVLAPQFLGLR